MTTPTESTLLLDVPRGADGVLVRRSAHWGYNSIAVVSGDEALAVDPGLAPGEIAAFREDLGGRRVPQLLLTHSHHDHIRGWRAFGDAQVVAPRAVADKNETSRERILAGKRKFDRLLGAEEPDFAFPTVDVTFDERLELRVGDLTVVCVFLPGHSNCTSVAIIPELRTVLTADYLVFPGLPYCRFEATAFEEAHRTLLGLVDEFDIERAIPAHNDILGRRDAVLEAIEADVSYFRVLRGEVERLAAAGTGKDDLLRDCARFMRERRGVDLGLRARQDMDNARRVLAEIR